MKRVVLVALASLLAVPVFAPSRTAACDAACQFETVTNSIAARDGVTVDVAAQRLALLLVPPPIPQGTPGDCESYRPMIEVAGLPWWFFGPVMWRESHCEPDAYNGKKRDRSYGIFQINTYGRLWGEIQWRCGITVKDQLFDPQTNIDCAAALYRAYGRRPWG